MFRFARARTRARRQGGFALVIVVVLAVAATAAVAALYTAFLSTRLPAAKTAAGDMSRSIAESGMARTIAYLQRAVSSDMDRVLDPGWTAVCNSPNSAAWEPPVMCASGAAINCFRPVPNFTDTGAGTVYYNSQPYRRVPYSGGAYLVQFSDDADDLVANADWNTATGNSLTLGDPNCMEGPAGLGGGDNPARDRNRTIWITVIGIYPGTNPAVTQQRTTLRKLHTSVLPPAVVGMEVKGNIDVSGSGDFLGCSPIGSIEIDGNFVGPGSGKACACGFSLADGLGSWDHCTDAAITGSAPNCGSVGVGCADGVLDTPGPVLPAIPSPDLAGGAPGDPGTDWYVDWSRPCVFWLSDNLYNGSLWFWDANAHRASCSADGTVCGPCGSMEGADQGLLWGPDLNNTGHPASYARCWTPLIVNANTTCDWVGPGASEVDTAGGCFWKPNNTAASSTVSAVNGTLTGLVVPVPATEVWPTSLGGCAGTPCGATWNIGAETVNKPAWASCSFNYPPYPTGALPSQPVNCGAACDGTNKAMLWLGGGTNNWWFNGASSATLNAVPAGVYIFNKYIALTGGSPPGFNAPNPPPDPATSPYFNGWPKASVLVKNSSATPTTDMMIDLQTSANGYWFGVGQKSGNPDGSGARYPSIMTTGKVSLHGSTPTHIAGNLYSKGKFGWTGGSTNWFYGETHLDSDFVIGGSGVYVWKYTVAQQPMPPASGSPPTQTPSPQ
ncbi:MAG: hypothetical protein ABIJ09_19570 [Pseudomonadota bacterium]